MFKCRNMAGMVHILMKNAGFEGILFPGNGSKDKVIIVMSGSNGGMSMAKHEAEFYHKNGIPAMSLALFKTKQTSPDLVSVPVEYVENAIKYLKEQGYQKIGIDGASKGSEMALVAASLLPDISFVIARVPSYYVSEGLAGKGKRKGPSGTSCWSYRGKDLPYAAYKTRIINMAEILKKEKEIRIRDINSDKDVTPDTIIPVENIKGPVLFLSSKKDEVWPSYESACLMDEKLDEVSFPYEHKHIVFENMSHAAVVNLPWIYKMAFKSERQHPKECAKDRKRMKMGLLSWTEGVWQ